MTTRKKGSICLDAARVLAARRRSGHTRTSLADLGEGVVSESTIQRAERGDSISLTKARALAELLGVELAALLTEESGTTTRIALRMLDDRRELVEREEPLETLERAVVTARSQRPVLVMLSGEPGVGKTALLNAVCRQLGSEALLLTGRGSQFSGARFHFKPFVEAMSPHEELLLANLDDASAKTLRRLIHATGEETGDGAAMLDGAEERARRYALFRAVASAVFQCSESRLVVLSIDDLQWLDDASIDLFVYLVERAAHPSARHRNRLLIVTTLRSSKPLGELMGDDPDATDQRDAAIVGQRLDAALARLQREDICELLSIECLSEAGTYELMRTLGMERPIAPLVSALHQAAAGNPLFVREIVKTLSSGSSESAGALGQAGTDLSRVALPRDITSAVSMRIRHLSPACREALVLAAVVGPEFELSLVASAAPAEGSELAELLDEAVEEVLVTEQRPGVYAFVHPLIRQVFYQLPAPGERQRMHLRVAEQLLVGGDARLRRRAARHLVGAGPFAPADAVEQLDRAARESEQLCAWHETAMLCLAAVRLGQARRQLSDSERGHLQLRAGFAYAKSYATQLAKELYDDALGAFRAAGDRAGTARTLAYRVRLVDTHGLNTGDPRAIRELEQVLSEMPEDEPALRVQVLDTLANCHINARHPEQAVQVIEEAVAIAQRLHDDRLRSQVSSVLAAAALMQLRVREALSEWQLGLRLARDVGDLSLEAMRVQRLPIPLFALGRLGDVERTAQEAVEVSARAESLAGPTFALAYHAASAVVRGELERGRELAQDSLDRVRRSRYPWAGPLACYAHAAAMLHAGDHEGADHELRAMTRPDYNGGHPGSLEGLALRCRALVAAYAGRPLPLDPADMVRPPPTAEYSLEQLSQLCLRVQVAMLVDRPELARGLGEALALAEERGVLLTGGWPLLVPRMVGLVAWAEGQLDHARNALERAVTQADAAGAELERAHSALDLARLLTHSEAPSDREAAREHLSLAEAICQRHGLVTLLARCRSVNLPGSAGPAAC